MAWCNDEMAFFTGIDNTISSKIVIFCYMKFTFECINGFSPLKTSGALKFYESF